MCVSNGLEVFQLHSMHYDGLHCQVFILYVHLKCYNLGLAKDMHRSSEDLSLVPSVLSLGSSQLSVVPAPWDLTPLVSWSTCTCLHTSTPEMNTHTQS